MKHLLELAVRYGGSIINSGHLSTEEIRQAQASNRFWVDEDSLGYAWVPDFKKFPETEEEVKQHEEWYPLDIEMPEHLENWKPSPAHMKQTVEEAAEDYVIQEASKSAGSREDAIALDGFNAGANWQAEQDKNLAIEFAEWILNHPTISAMRDFDGEESLDTFHLEGDDNYTTQQLFDKFMEQKTLDK